MCNAPTSGELFWLEKDAWLFGQRDCFYRSSRSKIGSEVVSWVSGFRILSFGTFDQLIYNFVWDYYSPLLSYIFFSNRSTCSQQKQKTHLCWQNGFVDLDLRTSHYGMKVSRDIHRMTPSSWFTARWISSSRSHYSSILGCCPVNPIICGVCMLFSSVATLERSTETLLFRLQTPRLVTYHRSPHFWSSSGLQGRSCLAVVPSFRGGPDHLFEWELQMLDNQILLLDLCRPYEDLHDKIVRQRSVDGIPLWNHVIGVFLPHLSFWLHHSPLIDLVPLFLGLVSSLADCQQENQHERRLTKERIGQSGSHILPILQSWTWNCKSVASSISYTVWVYLLFWRGSLGCHSKELTTLPTFFSGLNLSLVKSRRRYRLQNPMLLFVYPVSCKQCHLQCQAILFPMILWRPSSFIHQLHGHRLS